jgi:hypothetical protein
MFCSLTSSIHGQVKQSTGTPRPQTWKVNRYTWHRATEMHTILVWDGTARQITKFIQGYCGAMEAQYIIIQSVRLFCNQCSGID